MTAGPRPRFCPLCGAARGEGWAFCQLCGKPLPTSASPDPELSTASDKLEEALLRQAWQHLSDDELDHAESCLRTLRETAGDLPEALALLGSIRLRAYQLEEARELLDRALALGPASPTVRLKRAEYWLGLGVPTTARGELEEAFAAAAGEPALREHIRWLIKQLRSKEKRSFVRVVPVPALPRVSGLLKLLPRGLTGRGTMLSDEPSETGKEKGETVWLR